MVANDAVDFPDNVSIRDAIASGEIDVGLLNHYYVAQAIEAEGPDYPVKLYFPPKGLGSLLLLTQVGVLESSERKEEAFDFVRSLLSQGGSGVLHRDLEGVSDRDRREAGSLARRAARPDPGADRQPLRHLRDPGDDRADAGDRSAV